MRKLNLLHLTLLIFLTCTPVLMQAQTWTAINAFGGSGRCGAISFVCGTKAYVGSGGDLLHSNALYQDLWEYDPGTGVWTQKANMPAVRTVATGFAIGAYGYVVGGEGPGNAAVNTVYQYNSVTNTWATRNNFIGNRYGMCSFVIGGTAYAGMGASGGTHFNDFYAYNPIADTWTGIASFPGSAAREAMAFSIGATGLGYVGGGINATSSIYNNFYEYNPVTNTWTVKSNIPDDLCKGGAYTIGTIGYFSTGWSSPGPNSIRGTFAYNPATNIWATLPDYPNNQVMEGVGFAIGTKGYFGLGWQNTGSYATYFAALSPASVLTASGLSGTYYCPGSSLSVPYSSSGITFTGNTFTAQLSDANGQWSSPTNIGTLVSNAPSGNISCTLPAGASGNGYRIRIIASSPATTGGDNGTSLTIRRPVISITPSTAAVCSGTAPSIALSSDLENTTYSWTIATTATITGASACASSCGTTIGQVLSNSSNSTAGTATYTVTPSVSGCTGTTSNAVVTVRPIPQGSATAATICSGTTTSVTLNSTVSGSTFTWTAALISGTASGFSNQATGVTGPIAQTLINNTAANAVVRYTVTPTANSCSGTAFTVDVTVRPLPVASATGSTICSNVTTSITPTSNLAGTTYTWTASLLSGTATGFSNQTTASGSIAQQLFNTTTSSAVVRYVVTPTANTCAGSNFNVDVTVNPRPNGNGLPTSICSGNTTSMALGSNISGTTFTWTASLFSGTATGFSNQVTASTGPIAQTLSNTTNSPATVRYVITPTANSCTGSAYNLDAVVNPIPTLTLTPSSQSICSGSASSIGLSSNVAGATYSWTSSSAAGLSGASNCTSTCGTTIAQTITSTNTTSSAVTYTVTASANGCNSNTSAGTVNVLPVPIGSASPQNRCSGNATSVTLNSNVSGTLYTWTAALQSGTATGFNNQTTAVAGPIVQTLSNSTSTAAIVRYTVTPSAGGCTGSSFTVDVTVNPLPVMTVTPSSQTICSGTSTSLGLGSNVSGTTYTWTVSQGSGVTGATNCLSACGNTVSQVISNSLATTGQAVYTFTPVANGCTGSTTQGTVNVTSVTNGSASPQTICSGQTTSIALSSTLNPATFTWTAANFSGTASGFSNSGTPSSGPIAQTLTNTTNSSAIVRYTVTPIFQNCPGTSFNVDVTVRPQVVISVTPAQQVICNNTTSSLAYNSNVSGTTFTYTATNADGAIVNGFASQTTPGPAGTIAQTLSTSGNAGLVNYVISATANGCSASNLSTFIRVGSIPDTSITASGPLAFCNTSSVTLSAATAANVNFYANAQSSLYASGTEYDCDCPPGYVAVGIQGNTGGLIDNFKLICRDYNPQTGRLGSTLVYTSQNGISNGGGQQTILPGADYVLTGAAVVSDYSWLTYMTTYFKPLNSVLNYENNSAVPFLSANFNSSGGNFNNLGSQVAPNGYVVTGMKARNSTYSSSVQWKFSALERANNTYAWNTGSTASSITVSSTGSYALTVTNPYGCSLTSSPKQVLSGPVPVISASTTPLCFNSTKTLSTTTGQTYLWSNGATSSTIQVPAGQYSVTVNGCPSAPWTVIPNPTTPYLSSVDDTICQGSSTQLEAGVLLTDTVYLPYSSIFGINSICNGYPSNYYSAFGFEWVDNSNRIPYSAKIEFGISFNCFNSSMGASLNFVPIPAFPIPVNCNCNIATPGSLISVALPVSGYTSNGLNRFYFGANDVSPANDPVLNGNWGRIIRFYKDTIGTTQWSTGATTSQINVSTAGTYSVTITDRYNCVNTLSRNISIIPNPAPPVITRNFTSFCPPGSISASPSNGNYVWSNGATTATANYFDAGPFTVTITAANGCTASSSDTIAPLPGDTALFGNNAWNVYVFNQGNAPIAPNSWKTGYAGYFTANSLSFYSDNFYNASDAPSSAPGYIGCSTGIDNHAWRAKRRGFPCGYYDMNVPNHDDSYELWINGIRVSFHDGCCDNHPSVWQGYLDSTSMVEFRVTEGGGASLGRLEILPQSLNLNSTPGTILCGSQTKLVSITSTIPSYQTYNFVWSNGSTDSSITVTSTANVYATLTFPGGCQISTDTLNFVKYPVPVITPSLTGTLCYGQSNTLTTSTGSTYLWSTGATTASISVTEGRNYTVTVNGCESAPYHQAISPRTGQITLVQPTDDVCSGTPLQLQANVFRSDTIYLMESNLFNYYQCNNVWNLALSPSGGFSWTDNSGTNPDRVRVEWSLGSNCASSNSANVILNNVSIGLYNTQDYCGCTAPSQVIGGMDFPAGIYRTDSVNTLTFQRIFGYDFGFTNINYQMQGGFARVIRFYRDSLASVAWYNGATTNQITVNTSGNYNAVIQDTAGCTYTTSRNINMRPLPDATIFKSFPTAFCGNGYLYVNGQWNTGYQWSDGSNFNYTYLSGPGTYSVTVTNLQSGCTATDTEVVQGIIGDTAEFGNNHWIVYGFMNGGQNINSSSWTNYRGLYRDSTVSFNSTSKWGVTSNPSTAPGYFGCEIFNDFHSWRAKRRGFPCGYYKIDVNGHDDAAAVIINGVKVMEHANGCCDAHPAIWTGYLDSTSTIEFRVTEGFGNSFGELSIVPIVFSINGSDTAKICNGNPAILRPVTTYPGLSYLWSDGSTSDSLIATTSQAYTVTITTPGGCTQTADILVLPGTTPVITSNANPYSCEGVAPQLTASSGQSYLWNTGATTSSILPLQSGFFTVTVDGCTSAPFYTTARSKQGFISQNQPDTICSNETVYLKPEILVIDTVYLYTGNLSNNFYQKCLTGTMATMAQQFSMNWRDRDTIPVEKVKVEFAMAMNCQWNISSSLNNAPSRVIPTPNHCFCFLMSNNLISYELPGGGFIPDSVNSIRFYAWGSEFGFNNSHPQLNGAFARVIVYRKVPVTSILWSTGSTNDSLLLTTPGTYSVTFSDAAGCTYSKSRNFQFRTPPATPVITRNFSTNFCPPGTLTSSPANAYLWSNGSNSSNISIYDTGIYTLTVFDQFGCKAMNYDTVIQTAPGDTSVFGNNSWNVYAFNNGNFVLDGNAWSGYSGYFNTNSLSFNSETSFYLTPSNAAGYQGCPVGTGNHSWIAKRRGFPCGLYQIRLDRHMNGAIVILNGSVIYNAAYSSYWGAGVIYTGLLDSTSTLEFKVSKGMYDSNYSLISILPMTPTLQYSVTDICPGVQVPVTLSSTSTLQIPQSSYQWSDGTMNDTLIADSTELVYLNLVSPNCAVHTDTVQFVARPKPVITPSDTGFLCSQTARQLTASLSGQYLWNTGDTTRTITTYQRGNFTVTSYGCKSDTLKINGSPNYGLFISSNGGDTICPGYTLNLQASLMEADTFLIRPSNFFNLYNSGCLFSYSLLQFNWTDPKSTPADSVQLELLPGYQCNFSTSIPVYLNYYYKTNYNSPYNCTCTNNQALVKTGFNGSGYTAGGSNTIQLYNYSTIGLRYLPDYNDVLVRVVVFRKPSANLAYTWNTGQTTAAISVNTTGTYTVTMTDTLGCFRSSTKNILVQPLAPPVITRDFNNGLCFTGNLTATYAHQYQWSTGNNTQTIPIYNPGVYTVTITDKLGCSSTNSDSVPNGVPTTSLDYGNNSWNVNVLNDAYFSELAGSFTTNVLNIYSDSLYAPQAGPSGAAGYSGCYVNPNDHSLRYLRKGFSCGLYTIELDGPEYNLFINDQYIYTSYGYSNSWTGILDSTSRVKIEMSMYYGGGYSIQFTPAQLSVTPNGSSAFLCSGQSVNVTLNGAELLTGINWLWSNGSTAPNLLLSSPQNVSARITSNAGCSVNSDTVTFIARPTPQITASQSGALCKNSTVTLTSDAASNTWSSGATTASINVGTPGRYTVSSNGCTGSYLVTQVTDLRILSNMPDTICPGLEATFHIPQTTVDTFLLPLSRISNLATLCNDSIATGTNLGLLWNDPNPVKPSRVRIELAVVGECNHLTSYTTTLNGSNTGSIQRVSDYCNTCVLPGQSVINVHEIAGTNYRQGPNLQNVFRVFGPSISLTNANTAFPGYFARVIVYRNTDIQSILWNTGSTNDSITVSSDGTYTAYIVRTNGCMDTLSRNLVTANRNVPVITKNGIDSLCPTGGTLTSSWAPSYLWSTGETTRTINNRGPGTYTVTVSDVTGCSASSSLVIPAGNIPGNPAVFGNNSWNVYAFNYFSSGLNPNNWIYNYAGFYTDTTTFGFNSTTYWNGNFSPSTATGYQGCTVTNDNHSWTAKRQGFPCGYYQLNIPTHDDAAQLFINGQKVFEHDGCCDAHTNIWRGLLNSNSTIEYRVNEIGGFSSGSLQIVPLTLQIASTTPSICLGQTALIRPVTPFADSSGATFLWSNGVTNDSLYASSAGSYQLTVTLGGCIVSSNTVSLLQKNVSAPVAVISANPGLINCNVDTVVLSVGTHTSYLWSNGSTAASISITQGGTFTVTVTNDSGCATASAPAQVTMQTIIPEPSLLTSDTTLCGADSILLSATGLSPEKQVAIFQGSQRLRVVRDLPETNLTIEFWFRTSQATTGMFSATDQSNAHDRHIFLSNGILHFRVWNAGTWNTGITGLNDSTWHHLAYTMISGGGQRVYIDGQLRGSVGWGGTSNFDWQDRFSIGYSEDAGGTNRFFTGAMDDFRIWDTVRTASQIKASYKRQVSSATPGLIYALNFNGNALPQTGPTGIVGGLTYTPQNYYQFNWVGPNGPSPSVYPEWNAALAPGINSFGLTISSPDNCAYEKSFEIISGGNMGTVSVNDTLICVGDTILPIIQRSGSNVPAHWQVILPGNTTWTDLVDTTSILAIGSPPTIQDTGLYQVRMVALNSVYGCDSITNTGSFRVIDCNPQNITLNLKLYLQGFYIGNGQMNPVLHTNGISQNINECDTIYVDLADPFSPTTVHYSAPVVLHTDGTAQMMVPAALQGQSFYLVIRHRNSIATWSKLPVTLSGSTVTFDFSTP